MNEQEAISKVVNIDIFIISRDIYSLNLIKTDTFIFYIISWLNMDVRRVQITGGSSFMITLPKDWANSVGLKKNDTVAIRVQSDGALSLYPKGTIPAPKRSTRIIDATDIKDHEFFFRQLVGAYIAGHTTILIKSAHPMPDGIISAAKRFVQTSVGLEMIEANETQMLIANLIEHDAIDTKKIIERMGLLAKSMILDLYEAASTGDFKNITDMGARDVEVDRIYWMISRQYNIYQRDISAPHKMGISLYEMTACLFLSRVLEAIGDHAVMMSEHLIALGENSKEFNTNNNMHNLGREVTELLTKTVKSWVNKDIILSEQSIKNADEIIRNANRTASAIKTTEVVPTPIYDAMLFSSSRMAEYCKSIAEFAFNLEME